MQTSLDHATKDQRRESLQLAVFERTTTREPTPPFILLSCFPPSFFFFSMLFLRVRLATRITKETETAVMDSLSAKIVRLLPVARTRGRVRPSARFANSWTPAADRDC